MGRKKNSSKKSAAQQPAPEAVETVEAVGTDGEAETAAPEETTDEFVSKAEFDSLMQELESQKDQFLRMAAEYDNYRKRTEKEKLATYDNAVAASVEAFLPVIDNFALALDAGQNMPDEFRKGLELIQKKFDGALEKLHVSTFAERGDEFNPELHNAISRVTDPEIEEDHIASVYQKGFRIGDKIIRHAMVQVSDGQ